MIRRSCRTCGWSGTYATAGRGDYAKKKHSCALHLARAAAHERGVAKRAAIDRTPQPCHHKIANHQHGTRACYTLDRCRCRPCTDAVVAAERDRARQQAYGRYDKYVDAEPIRAHLQKLMDYGIGLKRVAVLGKLSNGALTKIYYGAYAPSGNGGGRNGPGEFLHGPTKRVTRITARKILAIQPVPANLAAAAFDHERTPYARLQIRALVALGWSQSKLGARIGVDLSNMGPLTRGDRVMTRGMVDRITALYEDLAMTLPPQDTAAQRAAVSRAKRYAADRGWVPPLALEAGDEPLDDDDTFDEVAVIRRLGGDHSAPATTADRIEIVRRGLHRGMTKADIERTTGVDAGVIAKRYLTDELQERAS